MGTETEICRESEYILWEECQKHTEELGCRASGALCTYEDMQHLCLLLL